MSERLTVNDVAKTAGCQVVSAALHTAQGQAAATAVAVAAVAAAPAVAGAAVGLGAAWLVGKAISWVDSL